MRIAAGTLEKAKVIVIRQPWAWLIVNGFKDIENRTWATRYRGPLIIQASARRPTEREMDEFRRFAGKRRVKLPEVSIWEASLALSGLTIVSAGAGANGSK